jgi:hypothetical protein
LPAAAKSRAEKYQRFIAVSTYAAIIIVALFAVFPSLTSPAISPEDKRSISLIGTIAGSLFALAMACLPLQRLFLESEERPASSIFPRPLDVHETYRLSMSLWVFVFSFGSTAAILATPVKVPGDGVDPLSSLGPRLFVSWFLSILTMVATRVLQRLDSLALVQESLRTTVKNAENLVTEMRKQTVSTTNIAVETIKIAAEAVGLEKEYGALQKIEIKMRSEAVLAKASGPTLHFVEAGKRRAALIGKIAEAAKRATEGGAADAGCYLRSRVMLPALLPYLATDPWQTDRLHEEEGIAIVQEGSYLLYAQLVEAVFLEIVRVCENKEESPFLAHCIEVFTTLNVPISHFYNIVVPTRVVPVPKDGELRFDVATTVPSWEQYRAMQTAAIRLGATTQRFALTRCLVTTSSDEFGALNHEVNHSIVLRKCLEPHEKLSASRISGSSDMLKDSERFMKDEGEGLAGLLEPLLIRNWKKNIEAGADRDLKTLSDQLKANDDSVDPYAYPILIETTSGTSRLSAAAYRGEWCPLPLDFADNYLSSPERGLRVDDRDRILRLPRDVFAVGWSENGFSKTPPAEWKVAFIMTLETDINGTQTRTAVLTPSDTGGTFDKLVEIIKKLSAGTEISPQGDGRKVKAEPLLTAARIEEFSSWSLPTP